ncbi:Protein CBG14470 [Caenorhabditis briggsae]|uniref:Protein CBG14470 n=1 Tax=Caenorhabditis briggsae TaxID=6238 RepID=A8XK06_CAEBR|nr:Protein CBG14470 [Caenorhabditis briggsae]CAP32982.2 Protein CBG14470 [Caenorhabditis briggsae]
MEDLTKNFQDCNVNDEPKKKLGLVPLAPKVDRNPEGTPVTLHTNLRKLSKCGTQHPCLQLFGENLIRLLDSRRQRSHHRVLQFPRNWSKTGQSQTFLPTSFHGGPSALSRASNCRDYILRSPSLFVQPSKAQSKKEIDITIQKKVSSARNFVRAEFKLAAVAETYQATSNDMKRIANACPALADKTFPEALSIFISGPAYANSNVITINGCVHYLLDTSAIGFFKDLYFPEGGLYTALGAAKGIKYLEGKDKNASLYMATELKVTLFHPDNIPLPELISQYLGGLDERLSATSKDGLYVTRALKGCEFYLNYSRSETVSDFEDNLVVKLHGFSNSATNSFFEREESSISVADHFREKYNIQLKYPSLMTALAKPKGGRLMVLPVELLVLCPSQKVTNERMVNNEQSELIRMSAAEPNIRKAATEDVVKAVGIASSNVLGFIGVGQPETVNGIVLAKPKITFADKKVASLNDPSAKVPTDFRRAGNFFEPKSLQKWEICYVECREMPGVPEELVRSMAGNGMSVSKPTVRSIREQEVQKVFENAKQANYQLIFFIIPKHFNSKKPHLLMATGKKI